MDDNYHFLLKDVINDLLTDEKSLVGPLMKLKYFANLTSNDPLESYTTRELEGYRNVEESEIPSYRKTIGQIKLEISLLGAVKIIDASETLLEPPEFQGHFRYLIFREGIKTIETISNRLDKTDEQHVYHPFPPQLLPFFEEGIRKRNDEMRVRVLSGHIEGNKYSVIEILTTVRSRLLNFIMEVAKKFGSNIEIAEFNKDQIHNNQIIFNIMNSTEIHNSGDGVVVNTGDHASVSANITLNKGDWAKLKDTLLMAGIDQSDVNELQPIIEEENLENNKLGHKTLDWILKISGKALQGVGKIATGVSSNLLATWIKSFYGM